MTTTPSPVRGAPLTDTADPRRRVVRRTGILLALLVVVLYGLIAGGLVTVIEGPAEQVSRDQFAFALPAAAVHAIGAFLLWRFDHRVLWVLGAALEVLIIAMYFVVAPQRDPMFELWGVLIRVAQVGLVAVLAYLATQRAR